MTGEWRRGEDRARCVPAPLRSAEPPAVWAPAAQAVDLVLPVARSGRFDGARRASMGRDPARTGWWIADAALPAGTDYGFRVDDGSPRPDPRSPRQPYGVHGPSRTFDPSFAWSDAAWPGRDVRGAVIYELHVGTFTTEGTLDAAAGRLGHLGRLGVDMVELMPVAAFSGRWGWGYDGVHLYAVHEPYGGPRALQRFVDAAHAHGIGVVLDVVYNHLGPAGNYLPEFGPYFTSAHRTPWGPAVNLDQEGSHEVRAWISDNAARWVRDFHIDGLRLDAVHALRDDSPVHLLAELSGRADRLAAELDRPVGMIAESDLNDPAMVTTVPDGGLGMTAQWADDVHHALHALLTGERQGYYVDFGSIAALRKALTGVFVHDGAFSTFRDRPWGAPVPAGTDRHRFVVFDQDHDQVGNRALGDRPSATLAPGLLAASAAVILLSPFTPMLFMGEEWGTRRPWQYFTDHDDAELARAVRDGRRAEFAAFGWDASDIPDPQDPATRERSVLDWSEPGTPEHARMLDWFRSLIELRKRCGVEADGDRRSVRVWGCVTDSPDGASGALVTRVLRPVAEPGHDDVEGFVVSYGSLETASVLDIVTNLSDEPRALRHTPAGATILLAWDEATELARLGCAQDVDGVLSLPARSVAVLGRSTRGSFPA